MEVLAGNHRLIAARELGWEHLAVVCMDVDEEQARRILLVDNRSSDARATNPRSSSSSSPRSRDWPAPATTRHRSTSSSTSSSRRRSRRRFRSGGPSRACDRASSSRSDPTGSSVATRATRPHMSCSWKGPMRLNRHSDAFIPDGNDDRLIFVQPIRLVTTDPACRPPVLEVSDFSQWRQ
jgi:hypothetical protein